MIGIFENVKFRIKGVLRWQGFEIQNVRSQRSTKKLARAKSRGIHESDV
jgi:hypothetical protein